MTQEQRYIIDQVGEDTDLEECTLCCAASCFSCVSDHCTALKKLADGGCVFYKVAEENIHEIRKCFYRMIQNERFDLLMNDVVTLKITVQEGYEIVGAYNGTDSSVSLQMGSDGNYYLTVPNGGGVNLSVTLQKKPEAVPETEERSRKNRKRNPSLKRLKKHRKQSPLLRRSSKPRLRSLNLSSR